MNEAIKRKADPTMESAMWKAKDNKEFICLIG